MGSAQQELAVHLGVQRAVSLVETLSAVGTAPSPPVTLGVFVPTAGCCMNNQSFRAGSWSCPKETWNSESRDQHGVPKASAP